ncbi:hypothetical protein [Sinorhizobium meliloti]|nr:hypothetical protein [Sinorhizobium meliloti]QND30532.1 hypothetical protein HB773_31730 [Sinorhizobium meliloti]
MAGQEAAKAFDEAMNEAAVPASSAFKTKRRLKQKSSTFFPLFTRTLLVS